MTVRLSLRARADEVVKQRFKTAYHWAVVARDLQRRSIAGDTSAAVIDRCRASGGASPDEWDSWAARRRLLNLNSCFGDGCFNLTAAKYLLWAREVVDDGLILEDDEARSVIDTSGEAKPSNRGPSGNAG